MENQTEKDRVTPETEEEKSKAESGKPAAENGTQNKPPVSEPRKAEGGVNKTHPQSGGYVPMDEKKLARIRLIVGIVVLVGFFIWFLVKQSKG